MKDSYNKIIKILEHPDNLSAIHLNTLVESSMELFNDFITADEDKKKEIETQLLKLREKLQACAKTLCAKTGISEEKIKEMANDSTIQKNKYFEDVQKSIEKFNEAHGEKKPEKKRKSRLKNLNYLSI